MGSGLGVGGGAGVGVVVPGPGVGRGRLSVAGCGRSPLLAEGLVGPPLCPSGVSVGPAAPLAGGCWVLVFWVCVCCVCGAGGACALVCGVRLWGSCRWRLWGCVLCACAGVCAVCWWCVGGLSSSFWASFGGSVWVWGLCVVAPLPSRLCGSPPPLAGVCWWRVPPPPPLRALLLLSLFRVAWGGVPLVPCPGLPGCVGGGGSLSSARVPSPGVSPWGGRCLHSPSGCNSVVRAIHLYPLGTNGPAP